MFSHFEIRPKILKNLRLIIDNNEFGNPLDSFCLNSILFFSYYSNKKTEYLRYYKMTFVANHFLVKFNLLLQ